MKCIECGAEFTQKTKTNVANLDNCVIIIKNVPALVCECGEVYYTDEVAEKIEKIVTTLRQIVDDVAVVDYVKQVA